MSLNLETTNLIPKSISFQWDFYERAINNYSIIMRILNCFEDEGSLVTNVPRIFVEESLFDMCKIIHISKGIKREGFFSLDDSLISMDMESIRELSKETRSPTLAADACGYGTLYIHPLSRDNETFGFLVLGKRVQIELDRGVLRELDIVCDIYNKSLIMVADVYGSRKNAQTVSLYEKVLDEFPDALLLVDTKGLICFANKRAKTEFQKARGLLVGEQIENVISGLGEDVGRTENGIYGEIRYRDGDKFKIFRTDSYPIPDQYNKAGWQGIVFRDVVDNEIRNEGQIVKEKMEGIGLLAGGIAHDFNNLLTGVLGYASLIKNFLPNEEKLYKYAEAIEHSAQRAAKLTQRLLNFSRRQRRKTGIVDLNGMIEDVIFLVSESFRDIEIEKNFCGTLTPVRGDEAELQNVFLNLCMNAKDAMDGKGALKVRTDRRQYADLGDFAVIEIEDTGKGIHDDLKSKIFEPYFTTKESGTNLGLGLYLVDKVIREHGGFIEFESEPGMGTKFMLYLPLPVELTDSGEPGTEISPDLNIEKRKILVVDDEDVVRNLLKGVLERAGVKVFESSNGDSAIKFFSKNHDTIDLVILDMIMPGIKGDEVLKAIRDVRKDVKVIISSGYMGEDQRDRLKDYGVDGFLDKPFRDTELLRSIVTALSK